MILFVSVRKAAIRCVSKIKTEGETLTLKKRSRLRNPFVLQLPTLSRCICLLGLFIVFKLRNIEKNLARK